jgi:hypothetical protein
LKWLCFGLGIRFALLLPFLAERLEFTVLVRANGVNASVKLHAHLLTVVDLIGTGLLLVDNETVFLDWSLYIPVPLFKITILQPL